MDNIQFAELWLDTYAEGGNILTMVENYRKAVPETKATDQSLKTALSTRATKIRAGFIALGKTEEEANALFPKLPRATKATKTGQNLKSALDRILELANAAKEQAADSDSE